MKYKRIAVTCLLAFLLFVFPACAAADGQNLLEIDDGTTVTVPEARWIFSLDKKGTAADGARYLIEEITEAVKAEIPVNMPFTVHWRKDLRSASYSVYAADGTEITWRSKELLFPEEPGDYICVAEGVFGTAKVYDGYQFLFCFTVPEA